MNQLQLTPYMQPVGMQPQVFYVIERNELFQLFKEWLMPSAGKETSVCSQTKQPQQTTPSISPSFQNSASLPPQFPPMAMPDGYYSREETARMLQVDKSTLWRWDKTGLLESVKLGPRKVGYEKDKVKDFIEKRNQNGF